MSRRLMRSLMKDSGMRAIAFREEVRREKVEEVWQRQALSSSFSLLPAPSAAQARLDFLRSLAHVGAALDPGLELAHGLAHVLDARGAGGGDGFLDEGVDLGVAELFRQVLLEGRDLGEFLLGEF